MASLRRHGEPPGAPFMLGQRPECPLAGHKTVYAPPWHVEAPAGNRIRALKMPSVRQAPGLSVTFLRAPGWCPLASPPPGAPCAASKGVAASRLSFFRAGLRGFEPPFGTAKDN